MKNFSISKKLILSFGIIVLMLMGTTATGILTLNMVSGNFTTFYEKHYQVTNQVMDMRRAIQAVGKEINYSFSQRDAEENAKYVSQAQEELDILENGVNFLKNNFSENSALVSQFDQVMAASSSVKDKVFQLVANDQYEQASSIYFSQYQPELVKANDYLNQIYDASQKAADESYQEVLHARVTAIIVMDCIAALSVISTVMLAVTLTKSLTRPLHELTAAAGKMSKGDFDLSLTYHSKDELGIDRKSVV